MTATTRYNKINSSMKYQNSDRDDRPLKSKQRVKPDIEALMNMFMTPVVTRQLHACHTSCPHQANAEYADATQNHNRYFQSVDSLR